MDEYVILVDGNDNPIGKEEKVKCHLPDGKLHRAFTALIYNKEGKLLLTRRSNSKMLWPDDWDGTVASHPRESESYVSSAERRMPEEIGITCEMNYVNKFEYHVPYKDIGSENEVWPNELKTQLENNRDVYCPWMVVALYFLDNCESDTKEKFNSLISDWTTDDLKTAYENAIKHYIPQDNWRLVKWRHQNRSKEMQFW